jgi:nucleoid DNA-binding protein
LFWLPLHFSPAILRRAAGQRFLSSPSPADSAINQKPLKRMTLTKRDLVTRISNETGLVQQQVLDVVQKTLDYIAEALAKGDKVELRNFGVFEVKVRKARIGRNPNAPETDVPIPERSVVKFKPGKEMRAEVLKLGTTPPAQPQSPQV